MNYDNCCCMKLEDDGYYLEDVYFPKGTVSAVYLGPGGIFVVVASEHDFEALYPSIRDVLGVKRVYIYIANPGMYYPSMHSSADEPYEQEPPECDIAERIYKEPVVFSEEHITKLKQKLIETDAYTRGHFRNDDGNLSLLKGGVFWPASAIDPTFIFTLTLYGGLLGLHRFAMKRFFSGVFYVLTCGGFLVGWLLDLLQLFCGIMKDKDNKLILPLQDKQNKLLQLIPGIFLAYIYFSLYSHLCTALSFGATTSFLNPSASLAELLAAFAKAFPEFPSP